MKSWVKCYIVFSCTKVWTFLINSFNQIYWGKQKNNTESVKKMWKTQRYYKCVKSRKAGGKFEKAKGNQKDFCQ